SNLAEVLEQTRLRRLGVVGRHDEQSDRAGLLRALRQLDGVRGVVRADTRDDMGPVADRLDDYAQQPVLLLVARRRRLPRRTGDDEAVVALVDEVGGERL